MGKSEGVMWRSDNHPMITRRRRRSRPDAPLRVSFAEDCSSDRDCTTARHPQPVTPAQPEVFTLDQRRKEKGFPLERSTSAEALETKLCSQHHIGSAEGGPPRVSIRSRQVRSKVRRGRELRQRHEYNVRLMPRSADQDDECGDHDEMHQGKGVAASLSTGNLATAWAWASLQHASLSNDAEEPHPEPIDDSDEPRAS